MQACGGLGALLGNLCVYGSVSLPGRNLMYLFGFLSRPAEILLVTSVSHYVGFCERLWTSVRVCGWACEDLWNSRISMWISVRNLKDVFSVLLKSVKVSGWISGKDFGGPSLWLPAKDSVATSFCGVLCGSLYGDVCGSLCFDP